MSEELRRIMEPPLRKCIVKRVGGMLHVVCAVMERRGERLLSRSVLAAPAHTARVVEQPPGPAGTWPPPLLTLDRDQCGEVQGMTFDELAALISDGLHVGQFGAAAERDAPVCGARHPTMAITCELEPGHQGDHAVNPGIASYWPRTES